MAALGSRRGTGRVAAALLGLLVALFVAQGLRIARLPTEQLVTWNVVIDDGYYYFQVARNLARGFGSTFDRVNRTNGYQPLWALALVPVFWFTDSPDSGLRAALVLATLLGALAVVLLYLGLARLVGIGAALLTCALVVANPYFLRILQVGLETPLLFFSLAGLVAFWAHLGERVLAAERRACLGLGLVLAVITLSRLDVALALLPLALVTALWRGPTGRMWGLVGRLRRALWIALPGLVLVLPYLVWNWVSHGSPVPVSGQVKSWVAATHVPTWDLFRVTEQWRGLTRTLHEIAWPWSEREPGLAEVPSKLVLPVLLLGLLVLRLVWSRRDALRGILVGGAATGVALHGLFLFYGYRSCSHWNYHYFFPFALLYIGLLAAVGPLLMADLARLLAWLLERWRAGAGERLRRGQTALGVALCLPLIGLMAHHGVPAAAKRYADLRRPPGESFRKCRLDAARNLAAHFPKDAVFGAWWAGTIGYFSDRRVVNLDGVINSGDYFRSYLRTDRVDRYILEGPIAHLVDFFWRDPLHPAFRPSARAFFWEHDKEHILFRLRRRLRLVRRFPFRGPSGVYLIDVNK